MSANKGGRRLPRARALELDLGFALWSRGRATGTAQRCRTAYMTHAKLAVDGVRPVDTQAQVKEIDSSNRKSTRV